MSDLFELLGIILVFAVPSFLIVLLIFFIGGKAVGAADDRAAAKDATEKVTALASDPALQQVLWTVRNENPTYAVVTPEGVELFFSQRVMAVRTRERQVPHGHYGYMDTVRDVVAEYVLPEGGPYDLWKVKGTRKDLWQELRPDDGSATKKILFADLHHANLESKVLGHGSEVTFFARSLAEGLGSGYVPHDFQWSDETCYSSGAAPGAPTGAYVSTVGSESTVTFTGGSGTADKYWTICDTAYIARADVNHNVPTDPHYLRDVVVPKAFDWQVEWNQSGIPDPYVGKK